MTKSDYAASSVFASMTNQAQLAVNLVYQFENAGHVDPPAELDLIDALCSAGLKLERDPDAVTALTYQAAIRDDINLQALRAAGTLEAELPILVSETPVGGG